MSNARSFLVVGSSPLHKALPVNVQSCPANQRTFTNPCVPFRGVSPSMSRIEGERSSASVTALVDTIHSMAEGCCSSTSVADPVVYLGVINICFSSGQECYTLPVSSSYLSSNPLALSPAIPKRALGHPLKPLAWVLQPYNFFSSSYFYLRLKRIHS